MNINKLNLNLLKTLKILLETRSVSMTSKVLNISQSAVSQSLRQLRENLNDQLLVRNNYKGMSPTKYAQSIYPQLRKIIRDIECLLDKNQEFDYESTSREFVIATADLPSYIFLPKLLSLLDKSPGIKVKLLHPYFLHPTELFNNETIDLIIGMFNTPIPETLKSQFLFKDGPICLARHDHPVLQFQSITLEQLEAYPTIIMHELNSPHNNLVDKRLSEMGFDSIIKVSGAHGIIPAISISNSNFINLTISYLANRLENQFDLVAFEVPNELKSLKYELKQYWHITNDSDPGHMWLRKQIKEIFDSLDD